MSRTENRESAEKLCGGPEEGNTMTELEQESDRSVCHFPRPKKTREFDSVAFITFLENLVHLAKYLIYKNYKKGKKKESL